MTTEISSRYRDDIFVDSFAGGGGASTGIELATGKPIDIAINHDESAIMMHRQNHPFTEHYREDIWQVDPVKACRGRHVRLAWFSPDCFEAGTLVLTRKGYAPIETVREGDEVLTHKMRWRHVTSTMRTLRDEMVVSGYGHYGIHCSPGHPFYVKRCPKEWDNVLRQYCTQKGAEPKWTKAQDIGDDDYWGTPVTVESTVIPEVVKGNKSHTLPIDERLMKLAGYYVGDGWLRITETRAEVVIVCGREEKEELRASIDVWGRSGQRSKDGELAWHVRDTKTESQFSTNCRPLVEWLCSNFSSGATEKTIPSWLLSAPIEYKKAFVDGYTGADGYKTKNLIETTTVSKRLAFGMKTLLATMGYSPTVYYSGKNGGDTIEGRKIHAQPVYRVKWRSQLDPNHAQTFEDGDVLWQKIKSSERTGLQKVFYNISVEEDESYVAEGIIVHNCKHFSRAKGSALVDKHIRGLAWVVLRWAGTVKPDIIMLENVPEFVTWGPVRRGKPVKSKAGQTYQKWHKQLEDLGYEIKTAELCAADYGAPTIRTRFCLIARRDGQPIRFPEPTHGNKDSEKVKSGELKPWRSAAEIIDWTIPSYSIFDTKQEIKERFGATVVRPLRPNTMRRIARGLDKFVLKTDNPFIIQQKLGNSVTWVAPALIQYHTEQSERVRGQDLKDPLMTVDASNRYGLISPYLTQYFSNGRPKSVEEPMATITTLDRENLAVPFLAHFKGQDKGQDIREPLMTITASDGQFGSVKAYIAKYDGHMDTRHWNDVRKLLNTYCGYSIGDDEILLLSIDGADWFICDIGLRMLTPRELYNAMGFPGDYIIDRCDDGRPISRADQVARCGNAVCPVLSEALVRANLPECGPKLNNMEELHEFMAS